VNFFTLLLAKLLSLHEARDKAVRFRVCQLVAKMMNYAADTQSIVGPQLMDSVQEVMLQRARDKVCQSRTVMLKQTCACSPPHTAVWLQMLPDVTLLESLKLQYSNSISLVSHTLTHTSGYIEGTA